MASICPQRVIKEAMRLLERVDAHEEEPESIDNNLLELEELQQRLYRAGITRIDTDGSHGGRH